MSADNFVGVYPSDENGIWHVTDGCMSVEEEDCQYRGGVVSQHSSREKAIVAAHDYAKTLPILEYGIIELGAINPKFCGSCYTCVHERGIIDETLERCHKCGKTISSSEWQTWVEGKVYHNRCEPGR